MLDVVSDVNASLRKRDLPLHHDIVENGAENASHHLSGEGCFRGQLALLCQLKVSKEIFSLLNRIKCEHREVQICFSQSVCV